MSDFLRWLVKDGPSPILGRIFVSLWLGTLVLIIVMLLAG